MAAGLLRYTDGVKHATLYRKWRPRAFSEISGQEPVVRTLRRAIETDRVAHAYLFSGPRGTGKTSTAKVLAMGLNCDQGPTPEPDGTCESCRAVINNSSMDVLEMDAASNRGIDEIRDLRDRVNLAPVAGRVKVYIIDEVHMLTTEAFNALLKMLEEPPEHVIFVLATTEKHKVLPTIISRCQSFDFRRPGVGTLSEKLSEIAEAEGIEAEPEALTIVAREGKGSFRDAEGLLDQLSSFAEGQITATMVRELLGSVGSDVLLETTIALHEHRAADALKVVDRLSNEGRDLGQFVNELLGHLRRVMLLPHAPDVALAEVGADERAPLEEQASIIPTAEIVRFVEALGETGGRIKRGGDPKLELELTFIKLARDYIEPSVDALLGRLEALEAAVQNGAVAASVPRETEEPEAADEPEESEQEEIAAEAETLADGAGEDDGRENPVDADVLAAEWRRVMQDLQDQKQALTVTVLQEGEGRPVSLEDNVLYIAFPEHAEFYAKEAQKPRHREAIGEVLEKRFGIKSRLEFVVGGTEPDYTKEAEPSRVELVYPDSTAVEEPEISSDEAKIEPVVEPTPEASQPAGNSKVAKAVESNDTIGSEQEAFDLAREWFETSNKDGGS
ncbi:MAG: DNA polymerase III subunit gamma/tau [Rubrobacteraceae bacterium]